MKRTRIGMALLVLASTAFTAVAAAPLPNVVLFLVDDMGWQDTSVPFHSEVTPLNRKFHTPNMERLATAGMKFTQAYSCSVCSPTRSNTRTSSSNRLSGGRRPTYPLSVQPSRYFLWMN
jgi:arylsulfatase A-like enzyme